MNTRELLDPTSERSPQVMERRTRPASLDQLTVGLLDIAKARGDIFLDRLHELFADRGLQVERFAKPTFTKVLPIPLAADIAARVDVVVEALAD
ncbi:MAG: hypothetical protein NVS2B16_29510 [Chloroflexota bacterium]